ncbi:MAG: cell division protein FtsL [Arenicellales bacterium]
MRLNKQSMMSLVLIVSVVATALTLVSVRQWNRMAFYEARQLKLERDDLAIEWRQLMAEYSTWRLEHNIEKEVRGAHDMQAPSTGNIYTIELAGKGLKAGGAQ